LPEAILSWTAVGIISVAATGLLLARDWQWQLGLMAAQYVGGAVLAAVHWPVGMAAAMIVAGWVSIAALGMTLSTIPSAAPPTETSLPRGRAFTMFMAGFVVLLAAGLTPRMQDLVPGIEAPVMAGAMILTGMGVIQLGTSIQIARIILGLLAALAGFEVFYSAVECSILVAGLLAVVMLGLGLAGAYLLSATYPEATE